MMELLEIAKKRIVERENTKKIKRIFSEEIPLAQEWKKRYSQYVGFLHSHKLWIQTLRLKIIDRRENSLYTTTEALRELLEEELDYFKIKKIRYRTDFKIASSLYFPYLYRIGEYYSQDGFCKVDVSKCFYTIYSRLGIDTNIVCEINHETRRIEIKAIGQGIITKKNSKIIRDLKEYKELRNMVYGLTRASWIVKLSKNKCERQFFRGRLQNLDLTVVIASILHGIVSKYRSKILYWNIDGGIILASAYKEIKEYLEEIGFELKKEEESTEAVILGLGSYKIGNYETLHFKAGVTTEVREKKYIYNVINFEKIEKILKRLKDE